MTTIPQVVGLALWVAALAVFWHGMSRRRKLPPALVWPGYLALLPIAFMLRGLLGEASPALVALCHLLAGGTPILRRDRFFLGAAAIAGLALNASGLGLIDLDLYGTGYVPGVPVALAIAALLLATYYAIPVLAWCWLAGLGLSVADLHPSPNVWDALIDVPAIVLMAILALGGRRHRLSQDGAAGDCGSRGTAPSDGSRQAPG